MEYVTLTINPHTLKTEPNSNYTGPITHSHHTHTKKRPPPAPAARSTTSSENRLLEGLAVLLDYLNDGDGPDKLARLRRRADLWCQAYYQRGDYTIRDRRGRPISRVPRCVFAAHPHLFSPMRPSLTRLDPPSSPPPLDSDSSATDSDSDMPSSPGSFDATGPEEFPAYAEPALLGDDALQSLAERYDSEREPFERRRHARILADAGTGHHPAVFDIRVRACDLLDSPILWYIPELLTGLAHMPPPPAYFAWLRAQHRPVFAKEEGEEEEGEVAWEVVQESEAIGVMVDAALSSSTGLKRKASGKRRHKSDEWSPEDEGSRRKARGWRILAMIGQWP